MQNILCFICIRPNCTLRKEISEFHRSTGKVNKWAPSSRGSLMAAGAGTPEAGCPWLLHGIGADELSMNMNLTKTTGGHGTGPQVQSSMFPSTVTMSGIRFTVSPTDEPDQQPPHPRPHSQDGLRTKITTLPAGLGRLGLVLGQGQGQEVSRDCGLGLWKSSQR